jgi:hypothetical protein
MAKNRMAGDKLDEPTQESADAKEALSQSEQRKRARERIGNDPDRLAERIGGIDREKYDFDGYSDKEINMAMQGGTFDENDYARLTGEKLGDGSDGGGEDTTPTPTPETDPTPVKPQPAPEGPDQTIGYQPPTLTYPGGNSQTQNINQDNDITTNVTGDGNTVTNNQDNSIGQYGGSSYGAYGTANRSKALRDKYVADVSRFVRA